MWSVLLGVFVTGGLYFGYLFYASVRDIVAYAQVPGLSAPAAPSGASNDPENPPPVSGAQLRNRVNILFLGIDRRENEPGPFRTDTMIVLSIDPTNNTASMLSIPRDLWVTIPDYNIDERINAANVYGDEFNYPGGGPALAMKTVQYNLGIPIHYYVRLDFAGFVKIVDAIGGVDIDVPRDIVDDEYPTEDGGTEHLFIPAGPQHMDGEMALKYARTRHDSSDIDRAGRQQQVIMAVRDKILSLNFPVSRIPEQLRILGDSVDTDMSLEVMYAVAQAARQIPTESIRRGVIDDTMVTDWTTPQGWEVLVPQRDQIRTLVDDLFPPSTPEVPLGALGDTAKLMDEAARVDVQNGTSTVGLASGVATDLRSRGYNVVDFGNADRFDYPQTVIICYVDKRYTLQSLQQYLGVPDARVIRQSIPNPDVDLRVVLGNDQATAGQ